MAVVAAREFLQSAHTRLSNFSNSSQGKVLIVTGIALTAIAAAVGALTICVLSPPFSSSLSFFSPLASIGFQGALAMTTAGGVTSLLLIAFLGCCSKKNAPLVFAPATPSSTHRKSVSVQNAQKIDANANLWAKAKDKEKENLPTNHYFTYSVSLEGELKRRFIWRVKTENVDYYGHKKEEDSSVEFKNIENILKNKLTLVTEHPFKEPQQLNIEV